MKQIGMFDESKALSYLSKLGDKLEWLDSVIDWAIFAMILEKAKPNRATGPKGGRPPYSNLIMFKIVLLQELYNISDEQMEYQINDRLSWRRFLGMSLSDKAPDRTTIWEFREAIRRVHDELFDLFNVKMEEIGVITHKGSIVDASFVDVPRQRFTRREKEALEQDKTPDEWKENAHIEPQRDLDAAWAKKNDEVHFGYKNHIKCDKDSKLILESFLTAANVHDSQIIALLMNEWDVAIWADSAYIGQNIALELRELNPKMKLNIIEKGFKNHPLTDEQKENNREKSRIRVRVEHVFGHMTNAMGGMFFRRIGIARAECAITLKNLAYNISRFATLRKLKKAPAMA